MSVIYVEITATRGSAPRDAGTVMQVTAFDSSGTIGGGALEYAAIATAREMLKSDAPEMTRNYPLGPNLGQCCGGAVTLLFSRTPRLAGDAAGFIAAHPPVSGPKRHLWIWGAGHVGRALVAQAHPTKGFDITWVDTAPERFPRAIPQGVTRIPTRDMPRIVPYAPKDALHLIVTYSHDIDLALCAALLRHGFGSCGLIGSGTKWARFSKRLSALSLSPEAITCPIGDRSLGKEPACIASGTIAAILAQDAWKESA